MSSTMTPSNPAPGPAVVTNSAAAPPTTRRLMFPERALGVLLYLWRERRALILGGITVPVLCLIGFALNDYPVFQWITWDILITISTLTVGVVIFFGESTDHWEMRLPKRLTVFFQYGGKTRMVCYLAPLAHEGDVRNWGMQIGAQMSGSRDLVFTPFIKLERLGTREFDDAKFLLFQAVFYLEAFPQNLKSQVEAGLEPGNPECCKVRKQGKSGAAIDSFDDADRHVPEPSPKKD